MSSSLITWSCHGFRSCAWNLCLFLLWSHIHAHQTSYNTHSTHRHKHINQMDGYRKLLPTALKAHLHAHVLLCGGCCWISLYRPNLEHTKINTNNISLFGLEWPLLFRRTSTHLFSFLFFLTPYNESHWSSQMLFSVHIWCGFFSQHNNNWMYNEICGKVCSVWCPINSSIGVCICTLFPWAMQHFLFN